MLTFHLGNKANLLNVDMSHDICYFKCEMYCFCCHETYSLKHIRQLFTLCSQIQDFIINNIVSIQVKNIPDLLQSSSVIGSALRGTETVSSKSLVSEY